MKIMRIVRSCTISLRSLALVLSLACALLAAADVAGAQRRAAVLPFSINAGQDLEYLKNGILDMLESRIAAIEGVRIVDRDKTFHHLAEAGGAVHSASQAARLGSAIDADYVIGGSLTVVGETISIDVQAVDVAAAQAVMSYNRTAQGLSSIIPEINRVAGEIETRVFGAQPAATASGAAAGTEHTAADAAAEMDRTAADAATAAAQQPAAKAAGGVPDPDAAAKQVPAAGAAAAGAADSTSRRAADRMPSTRSQGGLAFKDGAWSSPILKEYLIGLDVGDVDQDGRSEAVMLTPEQVMIYRVENSRLARKAEFRDSRYLQHIAVDVADINGNGRPEIYVTSLTIDGDDVSSYVVEYDGSRFATILNKSPWYFRVVTDRSGAPVLLGQEQRAGDHDVFTLPVYRLEWAGGRLEAGTELIGARKANALGVAMGDVFGTGENALAFFHDNDRIHLVDSRGETRFRTKDKYGGSNLSLVLPKRSEGEADNLAFFPIRLLLRDVDADGTTELIAARNEEMLRRMLRRVRIFTGSQIEVMQWDGVGLTVQWQSPELSGYVGDLVIADVDDDGRQELIATLIEKEGTTVLVNPKSRVMALQLPLQ